MSDPSPSRVAQQGNRTIDLYGHLMQINASSHLLRTARRVGVIDELRSGQRTLDELCQAKFLNRDATELLLDALVAIGVVEKYGEDYAISQAGRLLNQYDQDLGDDFWETLPGLLTGATPREAIDARPMEHRDTATQWTQTSAAMQAAEILDVGGESSASGMRILDVGCGAAVWSSAIAHRDPESTVVAIDHEEVRTAACNTADSISLGERFEFRAGDPRTVELETDQYDLALIATRLHQMDDDAAATVLARTADAVRPGGRVAVIDLFRVPSRKNLTETIEALRLQIGTPGGRMRTLSEGEQMMAAAGLESVQFTFLPISRSGLGMCVGVTPTPSAA